MGKGDMNMQMVIILKESFRMGGDKEKEFIVGKMETNLLDIGKMIKWMEREISYNKIEIL